MLNIAINTNDITRVKADVIVLQYAQGFYGASRTVADLLPGKPDRLRLQAGQFQTFDIGGRMRGSRVLFLATKTISRLGHEQIRNFSRDAVRVSCENFPNARSVAMTISGVNSDLDEKEAFVSQLIGIFQANTTGATKGLRAIYLVEDDKLRAKQFRAILNAIPSNSRRPDRSLSERGGTHARQLNATKNRKIFVAMSFASEMNDVFEFGIKEPAKELGLVCERIDKTVFTGDILEKLKQNIKAAILILADLSMGRPNVYLEIGYAWGTGRETYFIARKGTKLPFDVQSHRCVFYADIRELRTRIRSELPILLGRL